MQRLPGPGPFESLRFLHDPYRAHERWRERYGDLFKVSLPRPAGPIVVVARADGVRAALGCPHGATDVWVRHAIAPVFGERSILTTIGDTHLRYRKPIVRLLSQTPTLGPSIRRILSALPQTFDLSALGMSVAIEGASQVLFGSPARQDWVSRYHTYSALSNSLPVIASLAWPALRGRYYPPSVHFTRAREALRAALAAQPRGPALDALATALTPEEIPDNLLTLLFAAHDTTARAITWALHALLVHPDVLSRLQAEIDSFDGDPDDDDAVLALPLLTATVLESLRMYSIVLQTNRRLREPLSLLGHEIPAQTTLSLAAHLLHHDDAVYENAEHFWPERFLHRTPDPLTFLAFGLGARRCPGSAIATAEIGLTVFHLLRSSSLRPLYQPPVRARVEGLVLAPAVPLPVCALRRG